MSAEAEAQRRLALADVLEAAAERLAATRVVTGFDGFVDEMIRVVDERQDHEHYRPVRSMADFGAMIQAAAGRSSLREIVVEQQLPGGCAINLGDGLAALGLRPDIYATVGEPMHPAFAAAAGGATIHPVGRVYGRTLALEFADGKFMLSAVAQLGECTPEALARALQGAAAEQWRASDLIALTNWTLYPHMDACWRWLQEELLPRHRGGARIFIDLVDPRSRSRSDQERMLVALSAFQRHAGTVFGGNLNEANVLADLLGLPQSDEDLEAMQAQAAAIRSALQIDCVVTHAVRGAVAATADETAGVEGPYTTHPRRSTGAGDRFNAGFCTGLLLDLPLEDRLLTGCACSGWFVRAGASGGLTDLAAFLRAWQDGDPDAVIPD